MIIQSIFALEACHHTIVRHAVIGALGVDQTSGQGKLVPLMSVTGFEPETASFKPLFGNVVFR